MKWNALVKAADNGLLQKDWDNGQKIGSFRAGENWLFKKGAFGVSYVAYEDIIWAYRRIETVNGKLCCGKASFDIHHVILLLSNKKELDIRFEERAEAQALLDAIGAGNPQAEIGYSVEKQAKFA